MGLVVGVWALEFRKKLIFSFDLRWQKIENRVSRPRLWRGFSFLVVAILKCLFLLLVERLGVLLLAYFSIRVSAILIPELVLLFYVVFYL